MEEEAAKAAKLAELKAKAEQLRQEKSYLFGLLKQVTGEPLCSLSWRSTETGNKIEKQTSLFHHATSVAAMILMMRYLARSLGASLISA